MPTPVHRFDGEADARSRLIIALDVPSASDAREIVEELSHDVFAFKIGLQLFTAEGPKFVSELVKKGHKIFLDLKFHDIPNTMAMAAISAARLGVWMMNFHAAAGREALLMVKDAVQTAASKDGIAKPLMIGVTLLTSSGTEHLDELGITSSAEDYVLKMAEIASSSGLDGVVASAREAAMLRREMGDKFVVVTPGIRPSDATLGDQKRVTTFRDAIGAGASYVVAGRPVIAQPDRRKALAQLIA
jgi:orotidine-5'-phosphate decarboxylase